MAPYQQGTLLIAQIQLARFNQILLTYVSKDPDDHYNKTSLTAINSIRLFAIAKKIRIENNDQRKRYCCELDGKQGCYVRSYRITLKISQYLMNLNVAPISLLPIKFMLGLYKVYQRCTITQYYSNREKVDSNIYTKGSKVWKRWA